MSNNNATCTSVVIRPALSWFAAAGAASTSHATPHWATGNLDRVVLAAQTLWFRHREEGTILWQCSPTGGPARDSLVPMLVKMIAIAKARGCRVADTGLNTGWFTIRHEAYPTVHLGIGPLIKQSRTTFGDLHDEARLLSERLARYADVTGAAWRGTGGLSGTASIRSLHEANRRTGVPLWRWKRPVVGGMVGSSFELSPGKHWRPLTDAERRMRFVHHFDIRAMYLAACGVAMLGWSAPEHTGRREFDPGRAGYWQVRRAELDAIGLPVMREAVYRPGSSETLWLTTKVVSYLAEHGGAPEVLDSWTCERTGRYLRQWSERLTAARNTLSADSAVDSGVLRAVKDTYARTVGMFNRETSRVFRSDWWDTGRDTARINALLKVETAGVVPVRYNVDSIWVPTDRDPSELGARLGTSYIDGKEVDQVGKFKHIATYEVEEYLTTYQNEPISA